MVDFANNEYLLKHWGYVNAMVFFCSPLTLLTTSIWLRGNQIGQVTETARYIPFIRHITKKWFFGSKRQKRNHAGQQSI